METVVSITPIKLESDSRTLKEAVSIGRFGYRSIVVEGQRSQAMTGNPPLKILSINNDETFLKKVVAKIRGRRWHVNREPPMTPAANQPVPEKRSFVHSLLMPFRILRFLRGYLHGHCILPMRYIPHASLYYLHAPVYFPAVYLLSRKRRVPFIYDAHDFYSGMDGDTQPRSLEARFYRRFHRTVEGLCVRTAAQVVTVCEGVAELQRDAFDCRSVVIRNAHDLRLDREPEHGLRQQLGLSADDFLLVAIGHAKNGLAIKEALDALVKLPTNVHLAFVGKDYEEYLGTIENKGLTERAHVIPPVSPNELVPFIRSGDTALILYYPRSVDYLYSLPNKFFQSVAAELPLLYPELPEIKRLADRFEMGIAIDPQSADSIAAGVIKLMNGHDLREKYKRNLRVAKHELAWEREETILRDLIAKVLDKKAK